MATKNWTGTTSTDWFTATNWDAGVPGIGDDAVIGTTATSPTIGGTPSFTINSLTINGTDTLTVGDATSDDSLLMTITNGITLGGGGTITGQADIFANVSVIGPATIAVSAVNNANTPQLRFDGTISDPGNNLTLIVGNDGPSVNNLNADELILTGVTNSANAVDFSGGTGQLTLQQAGANVSLTVATAMSVGSGTVSLAGAGAFVATLTDASGVTLSTGTILGIGTVAADVTASGAAQITATGGTLEVTGAITDSGGALTLQIDNNTDTLLLDAASAANTVNFNGSSGTLELNSGATLTVGTQLAIGSGTVKFDGIFVNATTPSLTDANGVTVSTGTIIGSGIVNAAVTATGAANITAADSGLTLEVTGAITDSGNALTLTVGGGFPGAALLLDAASAANTVTFSSSGTLELNTGATLTVGTAMAIDTGTLQLNNGTLTDASNSVTLSTGTIAGFGFLDTSVTATGAATIVATGGTMFVGGPIADGGGALTLSIASASDTLELQSAGSAAHTVTFGAGGTLSFNTGATLTVATAMAVGAGSLLLNGPGSTLTDASGVTLAGGSILGTGKVDGNLTGTGTIQASGGTLELVTAIGNSTGLTYQIADGATNILQVDDLVGTGNTFDFLGTGGLTSTGGELGLSNAAGFDETLSGLTVGTGNVTPVDFVDIEGQPPVTISTVSGQGTTSGIIHLSDGAVLNLTNLSSTAWFANAVTDGAGTGTDIFVSDTACYCRGTRILTAGGEVAVEDLAIGDRVMTRSGMAQPIKWIGRRSYDGHFIAGNRGVLPVRIMAGAVADGIPARDLLVSPEHSLYFDGVLVQTKHLVNAATIVQVAAVDRVEYFHLELDAHDVIVAEGALAETYVDCDNRNMFHNGAEFAARYPDDRRPAWRFCAPRLEWGAAELIAIRAALFDRAAAQGAIFASDPELHLISGGAIIRPQSVVGRVYRFPLPAGSAAVWLASRSVVPAEIVAHSGDIRRLGVPLERIVLSDGALSIEARHDDGALCDGFHADEATHRWTDGRARLPDAWLRAFEGAVVLEVQLCESDLRYPAASLAAAA